MGKIVNSFFGKKGARLEKSKDYSDAKSLLPGFDGTI